MTLPSITVVPSYKNILQQTTDLIFSKYRELAPDFSNLSILLPHPHLNTQFSEALCRSLSTDIPAIIPPWSGTLKAWAMQFTSNQHPDCSVISEHARQLLFIEALQQHPDLFKEENQWQVTQALLRLFDELSFNQKEFFNSQEALQQHLTQAYGTEHEHLLYESKLVYTLWHAWQQQLQENSLLDETADYLSRLKNAQNQISAQQQFICIGLDHYTETEKNYIQILIDNDQCHVVEYANITECTDDNAFTHFISESFVQSSLSIKQRALNYANHHKENASDDIPFSTYLTGNDEQQIRAIELFVRQKILDGKNNIAIISEDRKLSRRLRALLERANIVLQDKAGWSLATTQAATIIERWLECIEQDFSAYPLLDCLKSPFIDITDTDKNSFRKNVYRFEHDLIFYENVSSNIDKYKAKLKERLKRLSHWPENAYNELTNTLTFLEKTAEPLRDIHAANTKIHLSTFLNALQLNLEQLGVISAYQNDDAGVQLLQTFEALKQGLHYSDPELSWFDCRLWLGMALENQHFTPATENTCVQLMTLEQASHMNFDCIVIAATESQHFPGSADTPPFFNQSVRASLGLSTWEKQREQRFALFSRTLLAAPEILLTACNEDKGEEKSVSPWLELLINFYHLVFNKSPENNNLRQLIEQDINLSVSENWPLPEVSSRPSPSLIENLVPEKVSASAYQRIINCPYQYFSADGLKLKALEELSDELKKSDYGERIHLILQCFHSGHKKYGKAFPHIITEVSSHEAVQYLLTLSEKIFLSDLENNVLHRSWLYRWQKHIPAYISWQIKHQVDWSIYRNEEYLDVELNEHLNIYGRLDRIDQNKENHSHAIIDYKTGKTAKQDDVDNGENVQLSTYALLDNDASEVSYLSVDSSYQKVETRSSLSGDNLEKNRSENKQRLVKIFEQVKNNKPMPAWGDAIVCRYCNFSGLCRKQEWEGAEKTL